jgi:hypothetical protein
MARQRVNGAENPDAGDDSRDIPVVLGTEGEIIEDRNDDGIPTVEPASLNVEPAEIEGTRRRGRPRGSKNTGGKQATKEVSQDLTSILVSLHFMGAAILKTPELQLSEDEGKKLGAAIARVNAEYGNIILPPKTAAWINLMMVGGAIYGPRAIAIRNNGRKRKSEQQPQPAQVIQ